MGIYDREYYRDEDQPGGASSLWPQTMVVRLIVVSSIVYFVNFFLCGPDSGHPDWLTREMSLSTATLASPWRWWQFVSYAFAHNPNNITHLLGNMIGLWFFGREIERVLGSRELLRFYLLAAIVGGLVWAGRHFAWGPGGGRVIGASGAVTAVVILFVLKFPHQQVRLMGIIPMPAWALGILMVSLDLLSARDASSDVAVDVHLTGAAFALLYHVRHWNLGQLIPGRGQWKRWRSARNRPNLTIHVPEEDSDPEEHYRGLDDEADRILDKLHRTGESSLTPDERRTLEAYSRRMRQKHR